MTERGGREGHYLETIRDAAKAVAADLMQREIDSGYRLRRSRATEARYYEQAWQAFLCAHDLGIVTFSEREDA